jgi:hypothetical protein
MLAFNNLAKANCTGLKEKLCGSGARPILLGCLLAATFAGVGTTAAQAAFISPSWTRPTSNTQAATNLTTYQSYNNFTVAAGPNAPDVANINPNGSANVYDTSGQSFITSDGNIYSFSAPTFIEAVLPNYGLGAGYTTNVLLQVRTLGEVMDNSSVKLISYSGNAANPYPSATGIAPLSQQLLLSAPDQSGFGGTDQEWAFSFSVVGNASSYKLAFNAAGTSMSLDQVSIDSQAVSSYLKGDFNLDGKVNAADISAAMAALVNLPQYQQTNHLTDTQLLQVANVNGDTTISFADLQSLLIDLRTGQTSTAAVPEPCTACLALLAFSGYWLIRPRTFAINR